jgi:hypothetical protein
MNIADNRGKVPGHDGVIADIGRNDRGCEFNQLIIIRLHIDHVRSPDVLDRTSLFSFVLSVAKPGFG